MKWRRPLRPWAAVSCPSCAALCALSSPPSLSSSPSTLRKAGAGRWPGRESGRSVAKLGHSDVSDYGGARRRAVWAHAWSRVESTHGKSIVLLSLLPLVPQCTRDLPLALGVAADPSFVSCKIDLPLLDEALTKFSKSVSSMLAPLAVCVALSACCG
jgi:hypothetical protein